MLASWLACVVVFLCLHVFTALLWGGGCGCVVGLGISVFGEHAHCRVHVQHRVSVRHLLVVVACAASLDRLWFGCGLCVVGCLCCV